MVKTLPMSIIADELARMRAITPLVHLLTNEVVQEITANVLLAAGASPAMIVAEEEASVFAAISGALLVNVGTLYPARLTVMRQAVKAANQAGVPWTLDPVAVGVLDFGRRPAAIFWRASRRRFVATLRKFSRWPGLPAADAASIARPVPMPRKAPPSIWLGPQARWSR